MHALVRVDAHGSCVRKPEGPPRLHPALHQVMDEAFAQLYLEQFYQPPLYHIQYEDDARDQKEDAELHEELAQVTARERIEKRLVPAI